MRISIITINYNNKLGLERTVKSVVAQKYSAIEFVIIDGGSSDGSVEVIKQYENYISYWVSQRDKGVYHAMNKGVAKATGDYLIFLNSGDDFHDEYVLENFGKGNFIEDIVYGNVKIIGDKSELITYPEKLSFNFFYRGTIIHQGIFFKRKCFEMCGGYDEELKIVADWKILLLSLCRYNLSYKYFPETIANFYADGISSQANNFHKLVSERKKVLQQEFPMFLDDYTHYNKLKLIEYKAGYIKSPVKIYKRLLEFISRR